MARKSGAAPFRDFPSLGHFAPVSGQGGVTRLTGIPYYTNKYRSWGGQVYTQNTHKTGVLGGVNTHKTHTKQCQNTHGGCQCVLGYKHTITHMCIRMVAG